MQCAVAPMSESEARALLADLGKSVCRTSIEREAFDWAEDVALWFFLDEAQAEWLESGQSARAFVAEDLAYRLGEQLPEMAQDAAPHEEREQQALARAGVRLADRLRAIAQAEG